MYAYRSRNNSLLFVQAWITMPKRPPHASIRALKEASVGKKISKTDMPPQVESIE